MFRGSNPVPNGPNRFCFVTSHCRSSCSGMQEAPAPNPRAVPLKAERWLRTIGVCPTVQRFWTSDAACGSRQVRPPVKCGVHGDREDPFQRFSDVFDSSTTGLSDSPRSHKVKPSIPISWRPGEERGREMGGCIQFVQKSYNYIYMDSLSLFKTWW